MGDVLLRLDACPACVADRVSVLLVLHCSLEKFITTRQLWNDENTMVEILLYNRAFFPVLSEYIKVHSVSLKLVEHV
jgi:hypothetical protein